jgi:hypothetical protein
MMRPLSHETTRKGKFIETESSPRQFKAGGQKTLTTNGHEETFWGDKNVLKLEVVDGCTI